MSVAITGLKFNSVIIQSLDDKDRKFDLTNSIVFCDYFEDILSPCVTMTMQIASQYSIFNSMPIRGGEKVSMDIDTVSGNFLLDGDYAMYVYKVSGIVSDANREIFTLHLVSREVLTNETSRVQKKYDKKTIDQHIKSILKDVLKTNKFKAENIEKTSNSYSFIGTMKKPFHVLTWLGPKGIPGTSSVSGKNGKKAKGVAGFLFYENKDGFNFRSLDTLVSSTKTQSNSTQKEYIPQYNYSQAVEEGNLDNNFSILNYNFEKNIDIMKSLRVGMYSNVTYFYDLYKNEISGIEYYINEELKSKLGGNSNLAYPKDFGNSPSRILVRTADVGVLGSENISDDSGRDVADMAKSFSRYNLLFTQSLNMVVPLNVNLKVGGIIYAQFQQVDASKSGEIDKEQSGNYLIKELRHHFEGGQMVTSLKLVRDSYGLYGTN
jgi:hypothetical protein